jgi:hypothetical protein
VFTKTLAGLTVLSLHAELDVAVAKGRLLSRLATGGLKLRGMR